LIVAAINLAEMTATVRTLPCLPPYDHESHCISCWRAPGPANLSTMPVWLKSEKVQNKHTSRRASPLEADTRTPLESSAGQRAVVAVRICDCMLWRAS
jgi:hypothetical protein